MNRRLCVHHIVIYISIISIGTAILPNPCNGNPPTDGFICVKEWEQTPSDKTELPHITKTTIVKKVKQWVNAYKQIQSWEVRYEASCGYPNQNQHELIHIVSSGNKWLYHAKNTPTENSLYAMYNGSEITRTWDDRKEIMIWDVNGGFHFDSRTTLPQLFPVLPGELLLSQSLNIPRLDLYAIADKPDIEVLPWRTYVDGQECYVLELNVKQQWPIFRNRQEANKYLKKPDSLDEIITGGFFKPVICIDPRANSGSMMNRTVTIRLAINPKTSYSITCYAIGIEGWSPYIKQNYRIFPQLEYRFTQYRELIQGIHFPFNISACIYRETQEKELKETDKVQFAVSDIILNKEYDNSIFEIHFKDGYRVMNTVKQISYTYGDPPEALELIMAGAKARDTFYNNLKQNLAPILEADSWLNSLPLTLSELKGKSVILHFWGINCAPCIHELSQLEQQYGKNNITGDMIFISIHPHIGIPNRMKLNKIIKDKGISFPVMIDKPLKNQPYWGQTFMKYRIQSIPREVRINEDGFIVEIDKEFINKDSDWIRSQPH